MPIDKRHMETLANCYLIRPGEERCKGFLRFQQGKYTGVEDQPETGGRRPAIYLRKSLKEDFLSLMRETEIALKKNKVSGASSDLAEAALVLNIAYRQTDRQIPLDKMLDDYVDSEATIFLGVPEMVAIMSDLTNFILGVAFGRFRIGGDAIRIHRQEFGESAAALEEAESSGLLKDGAWIMREPIPCRVLGAAFDDILAREAKEPYQGCLIRHVTEIWKADFENDQSIPASLGASAIDTDVLFRLEDLRIDVAFRSLGKLSQVEVRAGAGRSFPDDLTLLEQKDRALMRLIGDKPIGACPDIDRLLGTYSRFLLRAKSHETSSRASEAFIHCVFALDLALGGRQENTKNTTRRAAAIYAAATGTIYKVAENELRALFDARSKYVHEGAEVPEEKFTLLTHICSMVAECLLRARHATCAEHARFVTEYWYPRLDLVAAAMNAGVDLENAKIYRESGVSVPKKPASTTLQ